MLIAGGIILGGIFVLPKLLNSFKPEDGGIPFGDTGFQDFIGAGGTVTEEVKNDLPWWTFLSPLSMVTAYGGQGGTTRKYGGGGSGGGTTTTQTLLREPLQPKKGKGYRRTTIKKSQDIIREAANPQHDISVAAQIIQDIPKTITVEETYLQGNTVARLKSRAKYGTTSGR